MKPNEAKLVLPIPAYKGLVEEACRCGIPAYALRNEDGDWEHPYTWIYMPTGEKRYHLEDFSNADDEGLKPHAMEIIVGEQKSNVKEVSIPGDFLQIDGSHHQTFNLAISLAWANWKFPGIVYYVFWDDCEEDYVLYIPGVTYDEFINK